MKKTSERHPLSALAQYLPEGSFERVYQYILHYRVKLVLTVARKSILGNYQHRLENKQSSHTITVNGNLNPYELLYTFLHELAHLINVVEHGTKVAVHGREWKACYGRLLQEFVELNVFPAELVEALKPSLQNPSATANGERELLMVMRNYGKPKPDWLRTISGLSNGDHFVYEKHIYERVSLRRTRILCKQKATGKLYLFSGLTEVRKLDGDYLTT